LLLDKKKKILIAPLNWGLGHATRCVPIIAAKLTAGHEVIIAADGGPLSLLQQKFPTCTFITLKGVKIQYSKWMIVSMTFQVPRFLFSIYREHQALKKIISEHKIDQVISDNRYGLWNKKIESIFITHQINIQSPIFEKFLFRINCHFISKYNECWVPDYEGSQNLSGDLSHPKNEYFKNNFPENLKYIGPLSRFSGLEKIPSENIYEAIGIVSGPEPQRSKFLEKLKHDFSKLKGKTLIIAGKPDSENRQQIENVTIVNHLNDDEFVRALFAAQKIICRSGYSTIMDLHVLGLSAEFIATPGQTEQEYLAKRMAEK
jgi:uncharacterized protein (TIGR00661 family)